MKFKRTKFNFASLKAKTDLLFFPAISHGESYAGWRDLHDIELYAMERATHDENITQIHHGYSM